MKNAQRALLNWYAVNKRDLPWRRTKDPYKILVSEIMLQQTTVNVVIPFYHRFIAAFPDAASLACAPEEKVLSLWSGLGYYSRARNLQAAAKSIAALSEFPRSYEDLIKLKGVGPYTAAAVASIAFEEPVPAIDGNVIRVLTRLYNISFEVTSALGKTEISKRATEFISGQPPSQHNQAMMELGATICVSPRPACLLCPLSQDCESFKQGTATARPVKNKKRPQEPWLWTLFVVNRGEKIALVKNLNGTPWLKNTWTLPGFAEPWTKKTPPDADFKHSITHHKIYVKMRSSNLQEIKSFQEVKWITAEEIGTLGVSSAVQKAFKQLAKKSISLLISCFSILSCTTESVSVNSTSSAPRDSKDVFASGGSTEELTPITVDGENTMAAVSPDGTKIIYQSRNRSEHKNAQIYLFDLKTKKERRVTFNDGEDSSPTFSPDGKSILYASTTDELKEHPENEPQDEASAKKILFPNYEIYRSDLYGENRTRLTKSNGYDAEGVFFRDGHKIIFVSRREGSSQLFTMDSLGRNVRRFLAEEKSHASSSEGNPTVSPDGKHVAWSERLEEGSAQIIMAGPTGAGRVQLTSRDGIHVNPQFTPDGKALLFSSNAQDPAHFDIYYLLLDGTCLARLTRSPRIDLFPVLFPDKKTLELTSNRGGKFEIYKTQLKFPLDCISEKP